MDRLKLSSWIPFDDETPKRRGGKDVSRSISSDCFTYVDGFVAYVYRSKGDVRSIDLNGAWKWEAKCYFGRLTGVPATSTCNETGRNDSEGECYRSHGSGLLGCAGCV